MALKSSCDFPDIVNLEKCAEVNIAGKFVNTCSQIHIIYLPPLDSPRKAKRDGVFIPLQREMK